MENLKKVERELFATPEDIEAAKAIVYEVFGDDVWLDYCWLPKNVGVMGDNRVLGHSVLIGTRLENPAAYLGEHYDQVAVVSQRICSETGAACRVLFDLTPDGGPPQAYLEENDLHEL